jgi:hypothetical protein
MRHNPHTQTQFHPAHSSMPYTSGMNETHSWLFDRKIVRTTANKHHHPQAMN